jgi:hypothetical protein
LESQQRSADLFCTPMDTILPNGQSTPEGTKYR